ncbi:MAG TPA: TIGR00282 family metallophosphoesterase [Solirubrobacterales bacterium]|nr:TIGR00282 family metallophosphoesterase [Solirubrobacterales bacterium]
MSGKRVLFLGDIVGEPGRMAVTTTLPALVERHAPDLVVANGENVAGGLGITPRTADKLLEAGIDVLTTGNHVYRHRDIYEYLDASDRIVRPANYLESNPGKGYTVVERNGTRWGVVNLSGNVFMDAAYSPFHVADRILAKLKGDADYVIVDLHAEATSEKVAMGWHLDGRVTAVVGTHTHVPTADDRVLPGGTAYITDVGMTGPRGGVIGVKREQAIESLATMMPVRFETSPEDPWLMGVLISASQPPQADAIAPVRRSAPGVT